MDYSTEDFSTLANDKHAAPKSMGKINLLRANWKQPCSGTCQFNADLLQINTIDAITPSTLITIGNHCLLHWEIGALYRACGGAVRSASPGARGIPNARSAVNPQKASASDADSGINTAKRVSDGCVLPWAVYLSHLLSFKAALGEVMVPSQDLLPGVVDRSSCHIGSAPGGLNAARLVCGT